jgi:hypothetical protein
LSRVDVGGTCTSGIGTYVVINREGWIVTAHHIVEQIVKLESEKKLVAAHDTELERIKGDKGLQIKEKQKRIRGLKWPDKKSTRDFSVWYGRTGAAVAGFHNIKAVDIAVGKLEPFDAGSVPSYPTFKDPSKDFEPGVSLCKLGFPLHEIIPTYDSTAKSFTLPPNAVPLPLFPIDGILTRMATIQAPMPFPLGFIETSSPGLRGQSGGPTFDSQGTLWGIQVQTAHYSLGFETGKTEQFLNVGLGVSVATLLPWFDSLGIGYTLSAY